MGTMIGTMSKQEQGTIKRLLRNYGQKSRTQDMDLGYKDTVLGEGTKIGTLSKVKQSNKLGKKFKKQELGSKIKELGT